MIEQYIYHSEVDTRCFEHLCVNQELTDRCEICGRLIPSGEDFCADCQKAVSEDMNGIINHWLGNGNRDGVLNCIAKWVEAQ